MIRKLTLAAFLFACIAPQAHSQSTFGDIRGVTRDPSGLPLANAAVTVRSVEENSEGKVISDNEGVLRARPGRVVVATLASAAARHSSNISRGQGIAALVRWCAGGRDG